MLGMPAFFWTQSGTCAPAQKVAMLKSHATLFKEMTSEIQPGRGGAMSHSSRLVAAWHSCRRECVD